MLLSTLLLVACTSAEEKSYEDNLTQAKDKIKTEDFADAQTLLGEAIASGYENNTEAKNLLKKLEEYQKLKGLLNKGLFEEVYKVIDALLQIDDSSAVISEKAKEFKVITEEKQKKYDELKASVDAYLKLAEAGEYIESNKQLKALNLSEYKADYYDSTIGIVKSKIDSNDKKITEIEVNKKRQEEEGRQKAKVEKEAKAKAVKEAKVDKEVKEEKAKEEVSQKSNMLNWTDGEINQYMANHLGMPVDHLIIWISDKSASGYSIEIREDHEAMGQGDPMTAPALGFFEVRADGKLYQMDMMSGNYILVN